MEKPADWKLVSNSKEVLHIAPDKLTVHPDLAEVPGLSKADEEQLETSIREVGRVVQPLIVNSAWQILDGRHRNASAGRLQLPTVPVIVDDSLDALDLAISSALDRRHLSQGQRALFVFKLHRIARSEREGKDRDFKVKKSRGGMVSIRSSVESYVPLSARELGDRYHISHPLFGWLNQMWSNSEPEEWAEIVRLIETGEQKLKTVWHGFGGGAKSKGVPRGPVDVEEQIGRTISNFNGVFQYWEQYDIDQKRECVKQISQSLTKAPRDLAVEIYRSLATLLQSEGEQGQ